MPERLRDVNLLPDYERTREGSSILFFLFLLLTIASFALLGYFYFKFNDKLTEAKNIYTALEAEEKEIQIEIATLEASQGKTLKNSVLFVEQQIVETSKLITNIDHLLPQNGFLTSYSFRANETTISTQLGDLNLVADYTEKLTNSDFFHDVKLRNVSAVVSDHVSLEGEEIEDVDSTKYYQAEYLLDINRQMLKKEKKEDE